MQLNQQINYEEYEEDFEASDVKPETKDISLQTAEQPKGSSKKKQTIEHAEESQYKPDFQVQAQKEGQKEVSSKIGVVQTGSSVVKGSRLSSENEHVDESRQLRLASDLNDPSREKMIEQNIKLKTQIYELAKQMDEIMAKEKKHRKYGISADEQDDEALKAKKQELKKQQVEILNLKNKIFVTKRQLEHVYDNRGITGKEDELKSLQRELKTLQEEKEALSKVKREQSKALKIIRNDNEYENKIATLKESILKMKEECRYLSENLVENERVLRKNHEAYLTKQARIKEMEQKLKESSKQSHRMGKSKVGGSAAQAPENITPEMVTELEREIQQIEEQRRESEKSWNEKIAVIEAELGQKRLEEEKKLLILKDKEKELRLSELRVKELKKLIQHHQAEIRKHKQGVRDQAQEEAKEIDSREFRHKRNIKHL